ncbi:hypothetical protein OE699_01840 [Sedimentimonas flavescens]|uniref:Uncharacterized protein n=1 Tax=Sedimentimonas flavescens TaxID=2851012 RepID=A0ABT2ZUZ9_9RHOB|nr:hypothetical protein [Sedimentimonas flavescens]MCV2877580.1 hypothetical protein [Sedimentimonas flavescens]
MTTPNRKDAAVEEASARLRSADRHTPFGGVTKAERAKILESVARHHGCTRDELVLWIVQVQA